MLTLASSAFGVPGARIGANALSYGGDRSILGAGDSISHISGLLGDDERLFNDGEVDRDADASVRALRPRSSRRGSWESGASGWSGSEYPHNRSLWTSNSIRTGDMVTVDGYGDNDNDMTSVEGNVDNPIPGATNLSIADTVSEITDDGKTRDRSNTVTANDKITSSPLVTPTEPLPSVRLPDPNQTPKVDKEFIETQERSRASGERRSLFDEPRISPERTPAPAVIPLPQDTQLTAVSA